MFVERKDKGKKKRADDYDDDDDDEEEVVSNKGGKGGKAQTSSSAKGGSSSKPSAPAEFDLKHAILSYDAHVKKFSADLATIKIGKVDPSMVANVSYDGEPLVALAQIHVKDPQTLSVSLYDTSLVPKIMKTIQAADSSLVVNTDGKVIFIPIPKPTPEHKRNLLKLATTTAEKAKVDIRNTRRDLINDLKGYALPKDDHKIAENQIQKAHDDHIKKVDTALKTKESELAK